MGSGIFLPESTVQYNNKNNTWHFYHTLRNKKPLILTNQFFPRPAPPCLIFSHNQRYVLIHVPIARCVGQLNDKMKRQRKIKRGAMNV